ncbi:APC family permease [Ligilactobacillus sp. WILCCON 0076]|uniref:APC family permease n=1 Tax=Ligilactobacillus ubinensis TaxID=2876789 RepID=A0A9X2JJT7_9LACO|nr:APC family permease [Ligilactobacillus ubinensis]MCP0885778.1 APC family permease [Ligilactobacillus ubinensis]
MKKKLGFWSIVLLAVNSIIGSGIFLSPGAVVKLAGTKTIYIYIIAAIFATVLAITFAAAAKYVSHSGAAYIYAKAGFGENIGLYVGVTRYIASCIAWGVMATAVSKTILLILKRNPDNFMSTTSTIALIMLFVLIINVLGPVFFKFINNLATICKILVLVIFILFGLWYVMTSHVNLFSTIDTLTDANGQALIAKSNSTSLVMALLSAFYAFTGFESVASGADDMDNPEKNLPLAIPLSIAIIAVIYVCVIAVSMVANPSALVESKQVVALVSVFNQPIVQNLILYGALISMLGINVAASFHSPRILESMAIQGQLPKFFCKRTKGDVPLVAFLVTAIISIVLPMTFQYDMTSIIVLSSISRFIQFLVVPVCVIKFFFKKGDTSLINQVTTNKYTDIIAPVLSLIMTVALLIKFDWSGQFTISNGTTTNPNWFAISAMIVGYLFIPFAVIAFNFKNKEGKENA